MPKKLVKNKGITALQDLKEKKQKPIGKPGKKLDIYKKENVDIMRDVCSICLCDIKIYGILHPCQHFFCCKCIDKWEESADGGKCPLCKQTFYLIRKSPTPRARKSFMRAILTINSQKFSS